MAQDAPLSDRELLREVLDACDVAIAHDHKTRKYAEPQIDLITIEDIRARLAEPEEPTLRSLVGAVPDLTGGIESVTYLRMKREIAELRADRDALVPFARKGLEMDASWYAPHLAARTVLARLEKEQPDA